MARMQQWQQRQRDYGPIDCKTTRLHAILLNRTE
jgi:hypothetical protein